MSLVIFLFHMLKHSINFFDLTPYQFQVLILWINIMILKKLTEKTIKRRKTHFVCGFYKQS